VLDPRRCFCKEKNEKKAETAAQTGKEKNTKFTKTH
jgi:hypothetical protein